MQRIRSYKIIAAIVISLMLCITIKGKDTELQKVRCTCYLPTGNKTASGIYPYEGIVASNKDHLGQVAALYTEDMEFIGYFECKDTGGHKGIKNGTRIDVYRENRQRLNDWIKTYGDYVYIQWIDGKG